MAKGAKAKSAAEEPPETEQPEHEQPGATEGDAPPSEGDAPPEVEQPPAERPPAARVARGIPTAIVPEQKGRADTVARDLLLRACEVFGIDPTTDCHPLELMDWRFYPGSVREDVPDAVVLVTFGGLKLKWWADEEFPMDPDTDEKLGLVFNAFKIDPISKVKVRLALPADLTLPRGAVTGRGESQEHVYKGGYLRSGGAKEAARRQAARTR